jgi:ABC-type uncharacterized transport system substrate-binding protein
MNKWKARPNAKCISVWVDPKTIEMLEVLKNKHQTFNYEIVEKAIQDLYDKPSCEGD